MEGFCLYLQTWKYLLFNGMHETIECTRMICVYVTTNFHESNHQDHHIIDCYCIVYVNNYQSILYMICGKYSGKKSNIQGFLLKEQFLELSNNITCCLQIPSEIHKAFSLIYIFGMLSSKILLYSIRIIASSIHFRYDHVLSL